LNQITSINKPDYQLLFENCPGEYLVLLPDSKFTIIAVTNSYVKATRTKRSEILNKGIFEVFSENPGNQQEIAARNLVESLNRVIQKGIPDKMQIIKYDIRLPKSAGGHFEERYWSPINTPVFSSEGKLIHIIHRVEDVTELMKLKQKWSEKTDKNNPMSEKSEFYLIETALQIAYEKLRQSDEINKNSGNSISDNLKTDSKHPLNQPRERILVIEDNIELLDFFVRLLQPFYQVFTASNSKDGIDKSFLIKPCLIICELKSPQINGHNILNKIRSQSELNQSLFVFITKNPEDILRFQFFRKGIQDYLVKPLQAEVVLSRIQNLLTLRKIQDLNILDGVLENALDCVIGTDNQGIIIHWNSQAENTFGWTKKEALGEDLSNLIIPLSYRQRHINGFKHFLTLGKGEISNKRLELIGLKKNGDEFPIELSVTPIKSNESFIFYGFVRDITERIKTLEQLQLAKEQAESANYAKSAFLANMSHEIRSPLTAILGFTELLMDTLIDDKTKKGFHDVINRNGELLLNLINEILDLSKVESGKLSVDFQNCCLKELVTDIISTLKLKATQKGIKLEIYYSDGIPEFINTDPQRLKQILFNIIGNSIKFTDEGGIVINISTINKASKLTQLIFTVKDSGIGISNEERDKLFLSFSQVDTSLTRKFGGTGLGLALSKRFAKLLGGDIELRESIKGQGSTFTITIDPCISHNQNGVFKVMTPSPYNDTPQTNTRIDGVKILLTEDSVDNQFLISQILSKAGADVEIAENGKVAIEKSKNMKFDIFLIDIQMPVMDGYSTIAELRKNGIREPMIALTANALREDRERSLLNGFNEHISKPINKNNLIKIINNFRNRYS